MVNRTIALLLLAEIACLLFLTSIYARIHVQLATQRLAADERLLSSTSLNPRKGLAIWFGGLGSLWFRQRLKEIKALGRRPSEARYRRSELRAGDDDGDRAFSGAGLRRDRQWGNGEKTDFLAFLLYSGLMMGPVVRISSSVPEYREYALASRDLADAAHGAPKRGSAVDSGPLSFVGTDARAADRLRSTLRLSPAIESR